MKTNAILVLLFAAAAAARAQTKETPGPEMSQVMRTANEGLTTLRSLSEQMPKATGLTAKEAADARLGTPLRVYMVPLDRLKAYTADQDPRSLLVDLRSFLFPVSVGAETRSSLTVKEQQGRLVASDFGQADLVKGIESARAAATDPSAILVRVPALNLFFIGRTGEAFTLTPIADVPGTDLAAGRPANAAEVFKALAARAAGVGKEPT